MIVDAHTHIGSFGSEGNASATKTVHDLIRSMDEAGIDMSVIIANSWEDPTVGTTNSAGLAAVTLFPDRLRLVVNLDVTRIDERGYVDGLMEYLQKDMVVGLKLYSGYQDFLPNDERIRPLYAFCQERKRPVIFHTGLLMVDEEGVRKEIHPDIVRAVASAYPHLVIVIAHFGNPHIEACGRLLREWEHIYTDLSGYFNEYEPLSESQQAEFVSDVLQLKEAAGGLHKCMFGTDWWLYSQAEYRAATEAIPMSAEEREAVFSTNAMRVFSIKK